MKIGKIALIVTTVVLACVAVFIWKWRAADRAFVVRVTGMQFPTGTKYIARYDNGEWFIVSVFRLPENEASGFIQKYGFGRVADDDVGRDNSASLSFSHVQDASGLLANKEVEIGKDRAEEMKKIMRALNRGPRIKTAFALPKKYRSIPDHPEVFSVSGQTEYQSWEAVFDPKTRLLWIEILYPDWAGHHSGTAPQSSRLAPSQN